MNREDIIQLAREAGCGGIDNFEVIERFAELVVAAERNSWPAEMEAMERQVNILTDALAQAKAEEREACAQVCEAMRPTEREFDQRFYTACTLNANAIRARGETK